MRNGPLNYVRMRLARSIDARVGTATRIASDSLRAEMTGHVDQLLAGLGAEQQRLIEEHHQRQVELSERLDDIVRIADDDRGMGRHLLRELADELNATVSSTTNSVGSISASLTDAQRRQAYFVEQLARRVEVLEQSLRDQPAVDTTEPRS
jgi:hypothetical protein